LVPGGSRAIEEIRVGDLVLSRDEFDVRGEVRAKVVEEVFERFSAVWELRAGGQVILTTGEHPFFRSGEWVAAKDLQVGDKLTCQDGSMVTIEGLRQTDQWQPVYNLRIADYHTYFVGDDSWGWAAWSHNAYAVPLNPTNGHAYPSEANTPELQKSYRTLIANSQYTEYNRKHLKATNVNDAIRLSHTNAQYSPEFAIDNTNNGLELAALMHGYIVDHGGSWFAYIQFDRIVGYDRGKPTRWIRAEVSKSNPFDRHGHPMGEDRLPAEVRRHYGI
jgi:hypothetical protein